MYTLQFCVQLEFKRITAYAIGLEMQDWLHFWLGVTNLLVIGEIARIQQWVEHRVEGCSKFSCGEVNPLLDMGLNRDISSI